MTAGEKLNFLMKITGTKNRRLAQALCVDPSLICRFRSGARTIPEDSDYLAEIAGFFAMRCEDENYAVLLEQVLQAYLDPATDVRAQLERWLREPDDLPLPELLRLRPKQKPKPPAPFRCFTGPDAWREAVEAFSDCLAAAPGGRLKLLQQTALPTPQARAALNAQLAAPVLSFLERGGTAIRIVPQASTLTAETETARHWIRPLLTGNLQLFVYDGLLENALQTDLIVLSGVAALQSLRAAGETKVTVQMTTDPAAVAALETTLDAYLIACRPVSRIESLWRGSRRFDPDLELSASSMLSVYASLPHSSMPPAMLPAQREDLQSFFARRRSQLLAFAAQGEAIELFPLLSADAVRAGQALALPQPALRYTPERYAQQLAIILEQLRTMPQHHVCLIPQRESSLCACFAGTAQAELFPFNAKEQVRVMTVSHSGAVCALRQPYAAMAQAMLAEPMHRTRVIETLTQLRAELTRE